MEKKESDPIKGIVKALAEFQQACPAIKKDSKTKGGKFSFAYGSLPHILDAIKPHMKKAGLTFTQPITWMDGSEFLCTTLYHVESGEKIESKMLLPEFVFDMMNAIQSKGSVVTYYRRYMLVSILGIVAEGDDTDAKGHGSVTEKSSVHLPWLNPMENGKVSILWKEAVKYLAGDGKIESVKKKYKLSKVNEEKLLNEAMSHNDIPGLNVDEFNLNFENQ